MVLRIASAALAFTCAAALSVSANADTFGPYTPKMAPTAKYDGWYITPSVGGFVQNTPTIDYYTLIGGTPLFSANPEVVGGSGGVTLGIMLGSGQSSSWYGKKPRIEFSFGYSRGTGSVKTTSTPPGAPGVQVVGSPVDGSITVALTGVATSTTRMRVGIQDVAGAIRLKSDIHLARNLYLTPSLGFVGGRSSVDIKFDHFDLLTTGTTRPSFLHESLKTTRLGGEAAADLTWKIDSKWTLHGGASIAVFRMMTRFTANDCQAINPAAPGACGSSTTLFQTSASSFDHQTGFRVGMNTGVTYNGGWYKLTLVGQGTWDSDVPGVRNSTSVVLGGTTAPAGIVYSSQWRYGGFVSLSIPF